MSRRSPAPPATGGRPLAPPSRPKRSSRPLAPSATSPLWFSGLAAATRGALRYRRRRCPGGTETEASRARKATRRRAPGEEPSPQKEHQQRLGPPAPWTLLTSERCPSATAASQQRAAARVPGRRAVVLRARTRRQDGGRSSSAAVGPSVGAGGGWRCTPSRGSVTSYPSARGACRAARTHTELLAPPPPPRRLRHPRRCRPAPLARVPSRRGPSSTTSR